MSATFIQKWDMFWCRTAPPHLMAIFRIAFALFLLIEAATYLPHTTMMFSREGFAISMHLPSLPDSLAVLLQPPSPAVAFCIALIYVTALVMLALGFWMRFSIVILILSFWYYWQLSFLLFPSSYHRLYFFILWVLLFSGADKTFSLKMRLSRGSFFAWEPINIFPQRLIAVQMTATYLGVGWQKLWLPTWQGGDVLFYSFITRWWTPSSIWLAQHLSMPAFDVWVWSIKIFELLMPFGLWVRSVQKWFFLGGALFHTGIAFLMEIWWFLVLVPAYIVFLSPEEVYSQLKRRSRGKIT